MMSRHGIGTVTKTVTLVPGDPTSLRGLYICSAQTFVQAKH